MYASVRKPKCFVCSIMRIVQKAPHLSLVTTVLVAISIRHVDVSAVSTDEWKALSVNRL